MTQPTSFDDPVLNILINAKNGMHEAQDSAERVAYADAMKVLDSAVRQAWNEAFRAGRKYGHDEGYEDGYDVAVNYLAKAATRAEHPNS